MRSRAFHNGVCLFVIIMLCGLLPGASDASELQDINVKNGRTVTLQVVDVPLNEVLNILAKNVPMEIRGTVPSQERITVHFSNLTLEDALVRIMRGYNYVIVRPEESAKTLLVVMNKIERATQSQPALSAPGSAPAGPPGAVPPQGGPSRPGIVQAPPGQRQNVGPPPVMGPPETRAVGQQPNPESPPSAPGSGIAASPGAPFPGMPPGPGMPSGPPGMPSFGAGGVPPVPFSPPGATPPPEGAGAGGPQTAPPVQPQQPGQQSPEPTKVMTPFGERSLEPTGTGP